MMSNAFDEGVRSVQGQESLGTLRGKNRTSPPKARNAAAGFISKDNGVRSVQKQGSLQTLYHTSKNSIVRGNVDEAHDALSAILSSNNARHEGEGDDDGGRNCNGESAGGFLDRFLSMDVGAQQQQR